MVDRTLNEWSEWQLKNLNAIVWLYRGENEKYTALFYEYKNALGSDKLFDEQVHDLTERLKELRAEAKTAVEAADKREKKKFQTEYDDRISELAEKKLIGYMKSLEKESITISLDYVKSHIQQMTPNMMIKMESALKKRGGLSLRVPMLV